MSSVLVKPSVLDMSKPPVVARIPSPTGVGLRGEAGSSLSWASSRRFRISSVGKDTVCRVYRTKSDRRYAECKTPGQVSKDCIPHGGGLRGEGSSLSWASSRRFRISSVGKETVCSV
jgi:hypothetical protein